MSSEIIDDLIKINGLNKNYNREKIFELLKKCKSIKEVKLKLSELDIKIKHYLEIQKYLQQ